MAEPDAGAEVSDEAGHAAEQPSEEAAKEGPAIEEASDRRSQLL